MFCWGGAQWFSTFLLVSMTTARGTWEVVQCQQPKGPATLYRENGLLCTEQLLSWAGVQASRGDTVASETALAGLGALGPNKTRSVWWFLGYP